MRATREQTPPGTDVAGARPEAPVSPSGGPGTLPEETESQTARWYAVYCMSNAEFVVEDTLRGYGIEPFLPTWNEVTYWSDRKKIIRRPLFPGYLFARCDDGPRREILRIAGVIEVLPNNFNPQPVDATEIENVRRMLACGLPMKPCDYTTGDAVQIETGPLAGVKGIVQRTKNGTRVVVKIEMLKRAVSVEVDAADLTKEKQAA